MTTHRDKTDEQEEREKRVRALYAKFQFYRRRVQPIISLKMIRQATRLQPATASKILNGDEQFDQPQARPNLLKIITAFAIYHAMLSVEEANDFLQAGGFDPLQVMNKEDRKVINLLERKEINKYDNMYDQGVPLPPLSRRVLLEDYMAMLLSSQLIGMLDDTDRYTEPSTTTALDAIYLLLYKPEQDLFRRLGIFQDSCSVETAIAVCNKDDLLEKEALLASLEALKQLNFIEIDVNQQLRFRYPYLQRFALKKLQEGKEYDIIQEYDIIRNRYIDYYHRLIKIFIIAKYDPQSSPKQFYSIHSLLTLEKPHLYQAIEGMREKRENWIREKIEEEYWEYYDEEYYAAHPNCPYPFLEWWCKYVEYELNYVHYSTPNPFAQWAGRMYIKHFL